MIIGVTGGVGSGKSTVTDVLRDEYGYLALKTDDIAKELEQPGHSVYEELVRAFGSRILDTSEEAAPPISKAAFSALIYTDSKAMETAESIIHPAVWEQVEQAIAGEIREKGRADVVVETALPSERYRSICDEIWYVYVSEASRIARLMASRGYTEEKCRQIMARQIPEEAYFAYADHTVENEGSLEDMAARVRELMEGGRDEADDADGAAAPEAAL